MVLFNNHGLRVCIVRCVEIIRDLSATPELQPIRCVATELLTPLFQISVDLAGSIVGFSNLSNNEQQNVEKALAICASALLEVKKVLTSYASLLGGPIQLDASTKEVILNPLGPLGAELDILEIPMKTFVDYVKKLQQFDHSPSEGSACLFTSSQVDKLQDASQDIMISLRLFRETIEIFSPASEFRQALHAEECAMTQRPTDKESDQNDTRTTVMHDYEALKRPGPHTGQSNSGSEASLRQYAERVLREAEQEALLRAAMKEAAAGKQAFISFDKEADDALREAAIKKVTSISTHGECHDEETTTKTVKMETESYKRAAPIRTTVGHRLPHATQPFSGTGPGEIYHPPDASTHAEHLLDSVSELNFPVFDTDATTKETPRNVTPDHFQGPGNPQGLDLSDATDVHNYVSAILSETSVQNHVTIVTEILGMTQMSENEIGTNGRTAQLVVQSIFITACRDSTRIPWYVQILRLLIEQASNKVCDTVKMDMADDGRQVLRGPKLLRAYLRNKCRAAWLAEPTKLHLAVQLGFPLFMGHLYRYSDVIDEQMMYECASRWLKVTPRGPSMFNIGRLHHLLQTAGKDMASTETGVVMMETHLASLNNLSSDAVRWKPHVRSVFRDLVKMGEAGWVWECEADWAANLPSLIKSEVEKELGVVEETQPR